MEQCAKHRFAPFLSRPQGRPGGWTERRAGAGRRGALADRIPSGVHGGCVCSSGGGACCRRARQDSNLRLLPPEGSALSTELRALRAPSSRRAVLIAVISDTHMPRGGRRLPDACVERLAGRGPAPPRGRLHAPSRRSGVRGDRPAGAARARQLGRAPSSPRAFRAERMVEADGARIAMVHDAGPRAGRLDRLRPPTGAGADAVVFGHSHLPAARGARRIPDLQPGQPDRAPPRAASHHGHGPRADGARELRARHAAATSQ